MEPSDTKTRVIYFVGQHLDHAITNHIHDIIAKVLGVPWKLQAIDSPSLDEFVRRMRDNDFGGAVVTIPHKIAVMPHLDRTDNMSSLLGACNNVYKSADGLITGTNTDWIGVRDSLLNLARQADTKASSASVNTDDEDIPSFGKPGFVVGAGGASRAAIYTLYKILGAPKIYVVNRDKLEVEALKRDVAERYMRLSIAPPTIIHLESPEDVASIERVFYGVGTIPDFEPTTPAEIQARQTLEKLLESNKGVFLDMCYRPRVTRNFLSAKQKGWTAGDGGQVVAWQLKAQWELWTDKKTSEAIPLDSMVETVYRIIEGLP